MRPSWQYTNQCVSQGGCLSLSQSFFFFRTSGQSSDYQVSDIQFPPAPVDYSQSSSETFSRLLVQGYVARERLKCWEWHITALKDSNVTSLHTNFETKLRRSCLIEMIFEHPTELILETTLLKIFRNFSKPVHRSGYLPVKLSMTDSVRGKNKILFEKILDLLFLPFELSEMVVGIWIITLYWINFLSDNSDTQGGLLQVKKQLGSFQARLFLVWKFQLPSSI